jgi:hypothetical protein
MGDMNTHAMIPLSLVALLGCSPTGLLYPGDELRENPPGYGIMVIGAEPSIRLYTLEVCLERSCKTIGPFMRTQAAYLIRLPIGEHCLTEVEAEYAGSIAGGGNGIGHHWTSQDECFRISDGQLNYVGSFSLVQNRLDVVRRPDIRTLVHEHYPGVDARGIDEGR